MNRQKKKMRFLARIISMMLVLVLMSEEFLGSGNIVLAAETEDAAVVEEQAGTGSSEAADTEDVLSEEIDTEDLDILFEMEENRDQSSKHYRLSDGSIMATDYGMDIHYQKEGQWEDIDNRFVYEAETADDAMDGFATAEGDVEFKFAPDTSHGEVVRASSGVYSVGFEFLGTAGASENEAQEENCEETVNPEETTLQEFSETADPAESTPESESVTELEILEAVVPETAVPITFVKGDILNAEAAAEALTGTAAETSVLAAAGNGESLRDDIQPFAGLLAEETGGTVDDSGAAGITDAGEEIWAEVGSREVDASEEDSLMKQAALENVVTSVGYGNVLQGISLQYVAHGSSLKEYILVSEPQDSYGYVFRMDAGGLVPQMQEDGSILLADEESGEAVYEIPAAYMTDAAGAYSDAVEMEITPVADGTYFLLITADAHWIDAGERVFPVQIDPTLNKRLASSSNVRGNYVREGKPAVASTNYGEMYVGYDSSGNRNMKTYIQLRNLPELPKDSVICSAVFNMAVLTFSQVAWPRLHIQAREVKNTSWDSRYTWNNKPASETLVIDQRTITSSELYKYVGWNITSLVKAHYEAGNEEDAILAFSLEAYGTMANLKCANTALNLLWDGAEPIFQIFYRDTRGVEDYYTYQTQSLGNAGTGYISDYTSQLTVAKTVASYESTIMPYDIGLVYNSSHSGSYFTNGGDIHSVSFPYMNTGSGWKLTLQETVVPVSVTDVDGTATYLVYNDSDGTEHYFKKSGSDSSKYEDEDGLNLTITKSGTTYTMTDKKDNKKVFEDGYLTSIMDANGNEIRIVYDTSHLLKRIVSIPKGGTEKTLFTFTFDSVSHTLFQIEDYAGRKYRFTYNSDKNGKYQLYQIIRYDAGNTASPNTVEARYLYDTDNLRMTHAYDMESGMGVQYLYFPYTTGYRMYEYWEYAASGIDQAQTVGARARTWSVQLRQARYRFSGADGRIDTADDVISNYMFNSAGQTINARSENETTGQLLGVTASAYTKNSRTSKTNNRMNESISSGQAGVNLLINGGVEKETGATAEKWNHYASGGSVACRDGKNGINHSGQRHYNLYGSSISAVSSISQDVAVTSGETYTFSAYVNTRGATGFGNNSGVYLYVRQLSDQAVAVQSIRLSHVTDTDIDEGWQRISTTFTAQVSGDMRFTVCSGRVHGTVMVDDIQLEKGDAASRYNHVYNGSFENAQEGWDTSGTGVREATKDNKKHGAVSLRMTASVPEDSLCASQTIALYKSSNTTFLLSGWSMGNSIPDLESEIAGKTDTTLRYWGMTLTLNYSDGTAAEHFNLPFNDYATNWQYAAMSITPKAADKTITTAVLKLYYQNNANTAYFDNISLIEEPAQTYKYDKDGNLVSVKSSGNGEDGYEYNGDTQNLIKVATEGSGDYEYTYQTSGNKHLPVSIKNDTVTMDISYDSNGQAKQTTLRNNSGETTLTMVSQAKYNNGLLTSVTDNTNATATYTYDDRRRVFKAADAAGTETVTYYDDVWERPKLSYQDKKISIQNIYTKGNLTQIRRSGYSTAGDTATGTAQEYNFTYDAFGKNTSVSIGNRKIADYYYKSSNGLLSSIYYGVTDTAQTVVTYTYDGLDRVEEVKYYNNGTNETVRWGYRYSSDGSLSGITKNGVLLYTYDYDTLGRLIHSSMLEDGKMVLYTDHQYDTSDRILSQSWQIGSDGFTETYSYNEKDGTLKTMTTGGDTLSFGYDGLKRLDKRTSPVLTVDYAYRDISSTQTTTQVAGIAYKNREGTSEVLPSLGYTYDALGNITKVTSGGTTAEEYVYDSQNQLKSESIHGYRGGILRSSYTYDTYGNIRGISNILSGLDNETYVMEYGNSDWKDLLTKVTYTDDSGTVSSGTLEYDWIGNPVKYFNGHKTWEFTWKYGRQLTNATDGTQTIVNTYDVDGIRQSKTVGAVEHKYTTLDGKVVREETSNGITVDYFYDNEGKPYKLKVHVGDNTYVGYYVLNQQGDVIAIVESSGAEVVSYRYNAWGKILEETASETSTGLYLGEYNALKYRGYYYDVETGFYYVSSRYYDPVIGRFINADTTDVLLASPTSLTDKNLYSYCDNNPVMRVDYDGDFWEAIGIGFVAGVIGQYAGDVIGNIKSGKSGFDILKPTSSGRDYLASGIGGAIAAVPGLNLAGTMAVGAAGNVVADSMKGKIKSVGDLGKSAAWGAGANGLGYLASKGLAALKVKRINNMNRTSQKNYLNKTIYKSSRASINTNYHAYMSNGTKGKISIVEKSLRGFRSGIYSTFTSTAASLFR